MILLGPFLTSNNNQSASKKNEDRFLYYEHDYVFEKLQLSREGVILSAALSKDNSILKTFKQLKRTQLVVGAPLSFQDCVQLCNSNPQLLDEVSLVFF